MEKGWLTFALQHSEYVRDLALAPRSSDLDATARKQIDVDLLARLDAKMAEQVPLGSLYRLPRSGIAAAVRSLIDVENVLVDRPAAEAGLMALKAGGDFADGVIAHEGFALGADEFVSLDRSAVALLAARSLM